ncbi:MAG: SRPBCC family protein [Bacteroidota bacterium]
MNLESPKVTVQKSNKEIFDFLSNTENFEKIMPENIDKFEAGENTFKFALKGMPELRLNVEEQESPKKLVLGSASDKLPFTLTANIEENSETSSNVQLVFDGKINPMMAMMVKKPLQKFLNALSENIQKR